MAALTPERVAELLIPFAADLPHGIPEKLAEYLDLLLKWNARTNLTAIRDPEEIVQRHFGESLFAGRMLAERLAAGASVLDFGSGAGFPGIPMALLQPMWRVTLAESQGKKASFLREAKRKLGLANVEVWGERADRLPPGSRFDAVALRAVDDPERALAEAREFVGAGGLLVELRGGEPGENCWTLPGSVGRVVSITRL